MRCCVRGFRAMSPAENNPKKKGRKRKNTDASSGGSASIGRPRKKGKSTGTGSGGGDHKESSSTRKVREKKDKDKTKAPVDVERQCGVPLSQGGFCARSLTCKTHSMGAKRAVPGRSQPYDVLLAAYQKRNQVKQASLSTQQQLELDNEALLLEEDSNTNPEEEFEQVMAGVVKSLPVPLERKVVMPTTTRARFFRMREMLIGSLTNVPPIPSANSSSATVSATGTTAAAAATTAASSAVGAITGAATATGTGTGTGTAGSSGGISSSQQSVSAVMSATGALLGRTIVFDAATGAQYARPPRVYINMNQQQQQALLQRQRQVQMAAIQQAQAQAAINGSTQPSH